MTSFSYAGDKNRQLTRYSDTRWHEDSVRNRWFSVMAGPSVRVNEWFRSEDIRNERESVGNQRRILKNGCRIVSQFGGVIGIIGVCFKR